MNDIVIEILGQQPLNIFTQISFLYPIDENSKSKDEIFEILREGTRKLAEGFPWVSGQVINESTNDKSVTGLYKVKIIDNLPQLFVKDLSDGQAIPSFDELEKTDFPVSFLDESLVAPRSTIPHIFGDWTDSPVFMIQATFIKNGLILTFLGQHQVMDGNGQAQIISLFSKACRGQQFSEKELEIGNMNRENIINLLSEEERENIGDLYDRVSHQIISKPSIISNPERPQCVWTEFKFSSSSLNALKSIAGKSLPRADSYISTDDALSAFIWQSVAKARLHRLPLDAKSTLARAVDVRSYLEIPSTYPGMIQNMTYNNFTIEELTKFPLGLVASHLRSRLSPSTSTLKQDTRDLASYLHSIEDKSMVSFTASLDLSCDIALSSWSKQNSYSLDFGLGLSTPKSVRRPLFTPVEGLIYLLPKSLDGSVVLLICLRESDMYNLASDELFVKYAKPMP